MSIKIDAEAVLSRAEKSQPSAVETPFNSHWTLYAAVVVWILAIAGIAIHAFLNPRKHTVFPIYAMAAHAWWSGHPLYFQSQPDEFLYSPWFAMVVSPLAFIRESLGGMLWKILNATAFLLALVVWLKSARRILLGSGEVALVLLLTLGESLQSLYDGNANLLMLAAIMLALAVLVRSHTIRAGILLSLAALVKIFSLALVALLAASWGGAILWPFAAALGAGLLLPIAFAPTAGLAQTRQWFSLLLARSSERELRYCSIDQLFRMLGHPLPLLWSNALLVGAGLVAAVLCVNYARRADRRDALVFVFGVFSTWVVIFLPTMEPATIAFIAPPMALAIASVWRQRAYGWLVTLIVAWWLCGPALTDVAGKQARVYAQQHCAMLFGSLLFAAYLATVWKNGPEAQGQRRAGPAVQLEFAYFGIRVGRSLTIPMRQPGESGVEKHKSAPPIFK